MSHRKHPFEILFKSYFLFGEESTRSTNDRWPCNKLINSKVFLNELRSYLFLVKSVIWTLCIVFFQRTWKIFSARKENFRRQVFYYEFLQHLGTFFPPPTLTEHSCCCSDNIKRFRSCMYDSTFLWKKLKQVLEQFNFQ